MTTHHRAVGAFVNPKPRGSGDAPSRWAYQTVDRAVTLADGVALFDRRAWRLHRDRAAWDGCVDFLHSEVADRILDRLDDSGGRLHTVLDLGTHNGALSRALERRPEIGMVVAADPSIGFLRHGRGMRVVVDPELVPFRQGSFDLVVSVLVLHWVGDLPGTLVQLRRALKPDGLLIAAMLGGASLVELRRAFFEAELAEEGGVSPRVSPAADLGDVAALLLRAGYTMPVADTETLTVTYPDAVAMMRDLRGMGETNALAARRRTPLRRNTLARTAALYTERFGLPEGRVPATFEILFLTGRAP
jgi:SAM-dependent methyltransferase